MLKKNRDQPLVSVILPTYNHANFLKDAIESVIKQDYSSWELIIIDNYSTDHTDQVISLFKDDRIKNFKINNDGIIAKSRNKGIQESNGDWIAFLDSDDIWYFNKLSTIITYLDRNKKIDIVCSNEYLHNKSSGKKHIFPGKWTKTLKTQVHKQVPRNTGTFTFFGVEAKVLQAK